MKALLVLAVIAYVVYLVMRVKFWIKQGKLMQVSGHIPPPPTLFARLLLGLVARVIVYLRVGSITAIGRNNMRFDGRSLVAGNHFFALDFFVLRKVLGFGCNVRYLTKTSELKGLRGILGAWSGAIPVDTGAANGGQAAVDASVNVLSQFPRSCMAIFPQGKLVPNNTLRPEDFKTGAARIVKGVQCKHCDVPCGIIPTGIYYRTEREDNSWSHILLAPLRKLGGPHFYGAVVAVGPRMLACDLPEDAVEATEQLRKTIQALVDAAADVSAQGCCGA